MDQLVTFRLADGELAVPIQLVQEIIRVPEITKVPAAPDYVDGIGNLRGDLLPIVNLRSRLGLSAVERDNHTRVVVLRGNRTTTGVVVDGVSEVMTIDEKVLEAPPNSISGIEGQYLRSIAKVDDGKRLILILDEAKMLPDVDWQQGNTMEAMDKTASGKTQSDAAQLVTFTVGNEEFGIDIMQVKEIIKVTEITPVPKAPHYVMGVMSLRSNLLPIMDLRARFSMGEEPSGSGDASSKRIVVVDLNGVLTGIQVDSVSQVLTIEKAKIEPPPAIVKSSDAEALHGVGKLDGGKRIIMLLDVSKLVSDEDKSSFEQSTARHAEKSLEEKRQAMTDEAQLVCFHVAGEEYALDIMNVQEIIRLREITTVPHAKTYMEGIINLRGTVVPVIDMRTRFGLSKAERTDSTRIVVVNMQGKVSGLIVDAVSEVTRMSKGLIESPPSTVSDSDDAYIDGVAKLQDGKRIIILIKAARLLNNESPAA